MLQRGELLAREAPVVVVDEHHLGAVAGVGLHKELRGRPPRNFAFAARRTSSRLASARWPESRRVSSEPSGASDRARHPLVCRGGPTGAIAPADVGMARGDCAGLFRGDGAGRRGDGAGERLGTATAPTIESDCPATTLKPGLNGPRPGAILLPRPGGGGGGGAVVSSASRHESPTTAAIDPWRGASPTPVTVLRRRTATMELCRRARASRWLYCDARPELGREESPPPLVVRSRVGKVEPSDDAANEAGLSGSSGAGGEPVPRPPQSDAPPPPLLLARRRLRRR